MIKIKLGQYLALKAEQEQLEAEIKAFYETYIKSPSGSLSMFDMPRGSILPDPTAMFAERAARLHIKLLMKKYEVMEALEAIEDAVSTLEPGERLLMREHYINGLKWEKVCERIGYSWAQTHRIHRNAIRKLEGLAGS